MVMGLATRAVIYMPLDVQPHHLVSALYGLCQKGGRGCPSAWMRPQPDGFHSTYQLPQFIKAILNAADGSLG